VSLIVPDSAPRDLRVSINRSTEVQYMYMYTKVRLLLPYKIPICNLRVCARISVSSCVSRVCTLSACALVCICVCACFSCVCVITRAKARPEMEVRDLWNDPEV
jgi:hypothetical protein